MAKWAGTHTIRAPSTARVTSPGTYVTISSVHGTVSGELSQLALRHVELGEPAGLAWCEHPQVHVLVVGERPDVAGCDVGRVEAVDRARHDRRSHCEHALAAPVVNDPAEAGLCMVTPF